MVPVIVSLILLVNIFIVHGSCPSGWTEFEGSCYHLFEDKEEWPEAVFLCMTHKAGLVVIETTEENYFLENYIRTKQVRGTPVWIGANDMLTEGVFTWIESDRNLTFADWSLGQPDNHSGDEDCVEINPSNGWRWNDAPCNIRNYYICEQNSKGDTDLIG